MKKGNKRKCDLYPKGFYLDELRCIKNSDHTDDHKDRNGALFIEAEEGYRSTGIVISFLDGILDRVFNRERKRT